MASAVVPVPFCALISALFLLSICTRCLCPFWAAMCSGWLPFWASTQLKSFSFLPAASTADGGLFHRTLEWKALMVSAEGGMVAWTDSNLVKGVCGCPVEARLSLEG